MAADANKVNTKHQTLQANTVSHAVMRRSPQIQQTLRADRWAPTFSNGPEPIPPLATLNVPVSAHGGRSSDAADRDSCDNEICSPCPCHPGAGAPTKKKRTHWPTLPPTSLTNGVSNTNCTQRPRMPNCPGPQRWPQR